VSTRPASQPRGEQPQAGRDARRARRRASLGRLLWAAGIVLALGTVIWRQTVGADRMRDLEKVKEEIAVAQAEKAELQTKIVQLGRRERVVRYARERLGMHVARDEEIVLLAVPASAVRPDSATSADSAGEDS
jgi:cell division protein FtsL